MTDVKLPKLIINNRNDGGVGVNVRMEEGGECVDRYDADGCQCRHWIPSSTLLFHLYFLNISLKENVTLTRVVMAVPV